MGQPADTFSTYDAKGLREDLSDIITMISPEDTPFLDAIATKTAKATLHEWQTDSLASASEDNAVIEGDDATTDAADPTTRLGNYTQISDKVARVTGTLESVEKAGRKREMARQVMKKTAELKLDIEKRLFCNQAKVAGNDSTARETAGLESWIKTNTSAGAGGSDPATADGAATRTDGTQRVFTEDLMQDVLGSIWDEGGKPDVAYMSAFQLRKASLFTGGASRVDKTEDKKVFATVEVYVSPYGTIRFMPSRQHRSRSVPIVQTDKWAIATLSGRWFRNWPLAKTGDTERRQILSEYTLVALNEKASGLVADLTTS
jgi:hypothetical protein